MAPWLAVLTLTAAGAAAAVGYGLTAPKRYRATAQLLVSPVSVTDPTFTGLDVLRDSGGKRTAAASAAALLRSPQVADVVRADLGLARSRDSLLNALDAHVVDDSDVVAVTVEDTSAAGAAQLANAFADGLVKQRTASFQSQLATTIRRDEQLLAAIPPAKQDSGAGAELEKRLAVLKGFQGQPDPTIRHAGQASAPAAASWPELPQLALVGTVIGLVIGLLVALVLLLGRLGTRRGSADGDAPYDHAVSDRPVERLEQRVNDRIAALEEESRRLAAREASLAVRERDVTAKLDELRQAMAAAPADEPSDAGLAARAEALDARVAELTQREVSLARRAAEIAQREQELEESERVPLAVVPDEPARQDEAAEALAAREEALAARAGALDARVAELTQREIGLARRAAELAKRDDEVGKREGQATTRTEELAVRAAELEARHEAAEQAARAVPIPVPEPEPAAAPIVAAQGLQQQNGDEEATGAWNLLVLERLVNERGVEFPERRDEWVSYLYFLREYAEPDGTVPSSFDWLIQDTFSELVP